MTPEREAELLLLNGDLIAANARIEKAEKRLQVMVSQYADLFLRWKADVKRAEKAEAEGFILRAELDTETERADKAEAERDKAEADLDLWQGEALS